ncbi:MAG TPA: YdeI/OmpD-associated family protein [Actinomycetota bacterium]|nr:YdeI/OmpD-associated family protein [Actinomycetota bacterium]
MKSSVIELDAEPRVVAVPADFAVALNRDAGARKYFDGLTYTSKKRHVLSIDGAKTSESRRRRIGKSVTMLRAGRAR